MTGQSLSLLLRWSAVAFSTVMGVMGLLLLGVVGGYGLGLALGAVMTAAFLMGAIGLAAFSFGWTFLRFADTVTHRWTVFLSGRRKQASLSPQGQPPFVPMSLNEKAEALGRMDIFTGLPATELEHVAAMAHEQSIPSGESLAVEREPGQAIFFIRSGQVQLFTTGDIGEITVRVASACESLPLAALLDSGIHVTSARAMTDVQALVIGREDLRRLCAGRPFLGAHVYYASATVMARRYNETLQRMTAALDFAMQGRSTAAGAPWMAEPVSTLLAQRDETSVPGPARWVD